MLATRKKKTYVYIICFVVVINGRCKIGSSFVFTQEPADENVTSQNSSFQSDTKVFQAGPRRDTLGPREWAYLWSEFLKNKPLIEIFIGDRSHSI